MRHRISIRLGQFGVISLLFAGSCAFGDSGPYGKLPLSFEPNQGQTSSAVQWLARGPGYTLYLAGADAVLQLNTSSAVRMRLLGAKPAQPGSGEDPQAGKANYFRGNDPAKWQHDVPLYGKVRLRGVYPGVDLLYYGRQGQLEYDFVLAPGADASAIRLRFDGAKPSLGANGDLVLAVEGGEEIRFNQPAVYQMKNGGRQRVEGRFAIDARKQVSFHLGAYDRSRELVIDPTLDFLGILGTGSSGTEPNGMTVDALGEMILTGYTYDLDFPASTGAYQTSCGDVTQSGGGSLVRCGPSRSNNFSSAFVAKISADGTSLVYATYLHGLSGYESGASVVADAAGNAYVLGATSSNDFPITPDAYQTLCNPNYPLIGVTGSSPSDYYPIAATCYGGGSEGGGPSLFISKLNATGSTLVYSTFFGGTAGVNPVAIALDAMNNIYFTGQLTGALPNSIYYPNGTLIPFPTAAPSAPGPTTSPANAYQPSAPVNAAYQPFGAAGPAATLSKLSADGHILLYSTLLSSLNQGIYRPSVSSQALAVGPNGIAYIGGMMNESTAVCAPSTGTCNGFPVTSGVVKEACVVSGGNAGNCVSPTGFLSAFDTTQSGAASLVYSTLIGGTEAGGNAIQQVLGLAADSSNNVYVTGNTNATDYPTTAGAYQTTCMLHGTVCNTAFLSKINPTGTAYVWSTLCGADQPNLYSIGEAIGLDGQGQVYLYGLAASGGADYVNPIQPSKYGADKPFIGMFSADGSTLVFATQVGNSSTTTNENDEPIPSGGLNVDAGGNMYFAGYAADGGQLAATSGAYSQAAVSSGYRAFFGKLSCVFSPCPTPPPPHTNSIALAVSPNTTNFGQAVTMTATVTGQLNQPTPTGLVAFYNGSTWLGQAILNASGIATFTSSSLPAGVYTVTANYLGDKLYPGGISTSQSLNIASVPATTITASNAQVLFSQSSQSVTLTATVTSPGGVVNSGTVNFSVTLAAVPYTASAPVVNGVASASLTLPAGTFASVPGSYPIAAAYVPSGNLLASSDNTKLLTISPAPLVITWATPAPIAYGTPLGSGQLNAGVNPSFPPPVCVYTPPAGTILQGPGTYTLSVTCTPVGVSQGADYTAATATVSIQVVKIPVTIAWANPAPITYGTPLGSAQLNAIASPVGASASCVYTPALGTLLGNPGSYTLSVTCTPASNELVNYTAATATVSIQVEKLPLPIAWANPAPIANGTPIGVAQLNAITGPPTVLAACVYTPPLGTVLPGPGTYTLSATCTPENELADYTSATATVPIQVLDIARSSPTIVWATPAAVTAGTALSGTQLNATAMAGVPLSFAVPGTFVYTPALGTVLAAGSHQALSVTFTPADTTSYQPATAKVYINVANTAVAVSVETAIIPSSGLPSFTTFTANVTNASSTGNVTFTVLGITSNPSQVVNGVASGLINVPGGNPAGSYPIVATYTDPAFPGITASGTANLVISPPKVTISANNVTTTYSPSASVVTLTANVTYATSSGYVFFASPAGTNNGVAYVVNGVASGGFTIAAGTPAGTYTITANYSDPVNPTAYASATATLTILLPVITTPTITWTGRAPQGNIGPANAIFSGTPLSSAQLNATASVPGTFAYNPPAGTVLPAGAGQVLSVTFTPANPALYTTATATLPIYVAPLVTVTPANLTAPYSPTSQTILATATVTNANLYALTFSLLGSTFNGGVGFSEATLTIPAGTPVGTYPIMVTYGDFYDALTATGTAQLTIMAPPAGTCPSSTTLSSSGAQFNSQGAPNDSGLDSNGLPVALTRSNGVKKTVVTTLTPDNLMVSGGIQTIAVNSQGSGGLALSIATIGSFPPLDLTGGEVSVTGTGGTESGTIPPSTTPIVGCVASPFFASISGASLASGSSAIGSVSATLQDPATQNVFGLQISQRVILP